MTLFRPSQVFSKPVWQTGTGVPADGRRDLPDVAMIASAIPAEINTAIPNEMYSWAKYISG